ncbi:hypothetical protein KEM56_000365 [Ascosphaera pollenicola]|nr:hypothetical protein KEM56_000365 [Ascosphaera pollenicola]
METPEERPDGHTEGRVWVISAGSSLLGACVTAHALEHGDYVVTGVYTNYASPSATAEPFLPSTTAGSKPWGGLEDPRLPSFIEYLRKKVPFTEQDWAERVREISCNIRRVHDCQALVAGAIEAFGRIDILLCCSSQALVGAVEELAATEVTRKLFRDQFEMNYFGPVNLMRACLPWFRKQRYGHIVSVGGITGHLGTPGLGAYCSAGWALEGYCDTLAYEVAPFNVKVTTVQANLEVGVLTHEIRSVPALPAYHPDVNDAPLFRWIMNSSLSRVLSSTTDDDSDPFDGVRSTYVPLPDKHIYNLLKETVHALMAIGAHPNPPTRHIVGTDGVVSVKEKLKTATEEFEDFISCSMAVDATKDEADAER